MNLSREGGHGHAGGGTTSNQASEGKGQEGTGRERKGRKAMEVGEEGGEGQAQAIV